MTKAENSRVGASVSAPPTLHAELERRGRSAVLSVFGVVSVGEFCDSAVLLVSRGGRLRVTGERLVLAVFEGRTAEVRGKITGVEVIYGKN